MRRIAFGVMIVLLLAGLSFSQVQLTPNWQITADSRSWFVGTGTNANTIRGLAYNPITDHVLVVSRVPSPRVIILNAATGDSLGVLNLTGVAGGTFIINLIDVDENGVIYVCNLSTSATSNFKVYRWADEAAAPTVAFDALFPTNPHRYGDAFAVVGNATATQIYAAGGSNCLFIGLLNTTDGLTFTIKDTIRVGTRARLGVDVTETGNIWGNEASKKPSLFSPTGVLLGEVAQQVAGFLNYNIKYFKSKFFKTNPEFIAVNDNNFANQPKWSRVINVTNGTTRAFAAGETPVVGTTANTNGTGTFAYDTARNALIVLTTNNVIGSYSLANAEDRVGVTFQVDMSVQKQLKNFNPDTQMVVIRGNFIDEANPKLQEWKGNRIELFPDPANADVYTLTVGFPASAVGSEFEFKYVIERTAARGDSTTQGGTWESVDNRKFTLQEGGQILDKVFFNNQSQVTPEVNVTFKVKMNVMKEVGFFDPATQTVHVRGSFNNWGDGSDLSDADGDLTYEGTFNVGSTSPIKYKFVVKKGTAVTWEDNIGDRALNLVGTAMVLNPVEWTDGIQFRVNMAAPINDGKFNPATQFLAIMGTFNGWAANDSAVARKSELKDPDGDKIYVANIEVGTTKGLEFKFTIHNNSNGKVATWESHGNRTIDLKTATLAKPTNVELPWDGDPGVAVTGTVLFQVNISPLRDNGVFNEAEGDTLQVRGEFNGWSDADPATSIMRQSFLDPNIYELPITMLKVPGSKLAYKFYIKFNFKRSLWAGIENPVADWGYEEPGSTGGGNRTLVFSGEPQQLVDPVPYKDIYDFIPEGVEVTYNFVADMRCYLRDPANLADKNTDTLRAHIQDIVWHIFNDTREYQDANRLRGVTPFNFSDTDGDSIYTLALKTKGLNQNWVQYKLRWAGTEESAPGFEYGRRRVRYVRRDAGGNFLPSYQMGVDYFSTVTDPLPIETPTSGVINDEAPCTVTSVVERVNNKVPTTYSLGQNYPNPFNPTTTFEYTVPKSGHVSITLYNALGQKIADLVDEVQQAGAYKVTVDLGDLSRSSVATGVYFYTMKVGDFQSTRRMMFVK